MKIWYWLLYLFSKKKIKLEIDIDYKSEVGFLRRALEERHDKVVHDELLWDAWELSVLKRWIEKLKKEEK